MMHFCAKFSLGYKMHPVNGGKGGYTPMNPLLKYSISSIRYWQTYNKK